jgi:hypothetical protein
MKPPSKRNAPKAPKDKKLPWEKLYGECAERSVFPPENEWDEDEALENGFLEYLYGERLRTPPEPISLELLASTAAALCPRSGVNTQTEEEVKELNKLAAAQAYGLLFECGELLKKGEFARKQLAELRRQQMQRRELDKKSLKIKLSDAVHTITGYTGSHAPNYFRMFLEVFYGEVAAEEMLGTLMLCRPPLLSSSIEEGNYKQWATDTCERYQVHGLREDEVVYLTGKFTELAEKGYLGKSTQKRFSPTKAKETKTKG